MGISSYAKQLGRDTFLYSLANILSNVLAFCFLPILTRIFTPLEYGIMDMLAVVANFSAAFVVLGMNGSQTFYFNEYNDISEKKKVVGNNLLFFTVSGVAVFLTVISMSHWLNKVLLDGHGGVVLFILVMGSVLLNVFRENFLNLLRILFRAWSYMAVSLARVVLFYCLIVVLVVYYGKGLKGYYWAVLLSTGIFAAVGGGLVREWLNGGSSIALFKKMLAFGVPLFPTDFALWLIRFADRFFIKYFVSLKAVGIYAVGAKVAGVMLLLTTGFRLAWPPLSLSIKNGEDVERFYRNVRIGFLSAASCIVVVITGMSPFVVRLIAHASYYEGYKVVGLLSFAFFFSNFYFMSGLGSWLREKTHFMLWGILVGSIAGILLNILLIPLLGLTGAAIATCLAHFTGNVLVNYWSEKVYPLGFGLGKIIYFFSITVLSILAQNYVFELRLELVYEIMTISLIWIISFGFIIFGGVGVENVLVLSRKLAKTW